MPAATRAVTLELLDVDVDLDDIARGDGYLFVRDGFGFAGRGVAARVAGDEAAEFLGAIDHDVGEGGPAVVGFAAIPFRPGDAYEVVVPEVVFGKSPDGRCWATVTGDEHVDFDAVVDSALRIPPPPAPDTASFTVGPAGALGGYLAAVTAVRDAVRRGDLAKAVIAREVTVTSSAPISGRAVLARLRASFGSSYRYCIDGLIGASPELLVAVDGLTVRSNPLAGTAPRSGDPDTDARAAARLLASTKDQIEHRVVIDAIYDALLPYCSYLDWQPEPTIMTVANVQHLATSMEGLLSQPRPDVCTLARLLRPTPALGGSPRGAALALIDEVEGFTRGRYGGAVGWLDAAGNGTFAVTIRCAELSADRRSARLVAGGGIVADSDPLAELAETQAKFQAMLSAIVRP
ncbi:MAG: isochorismate synthase [Ilumatobacteraceae bacterium]